MTDNHYGYLSLESMAHISVVFTSIIMATNNSMLRFILLLSLISACSSSNELEIDKKRWIMDHEGCSGYRLEVYPKILDQKEKVLGLSNKRIIRLLGSPNINELYSRNQKFFIYKLAGGSSCEGSQSEESLFLILRFNATGLVNEIYMNDDASPTD